MVNHTHTVTLRRGDTLSELAEKFGTSVRALARANRLADVDNIYAGQKLKIACDTRHTAKAVKQRISFESGVSAVQDFRGRLVERARGFLGVTEKGGDNRGESVRTFLRSHLFNARATGRAAPEGASWCAGFASYVLNKIMPGALDYSVVAKGLMQQCKEAGAFRSVKSYTPKPGDLIFFGRGTQSWQGHVGFVERVDANGTIHTIEGNVDRPGKRSGPDGVWQRSYSQAGLSRARTLGFGDLSVIAKERAPGLAPELA